MDFERELGLDPGTFDHTGKTGGREGCAPKLELAIKLASAYGPCLSGNTKRNFTSTCTAKSYVQIQSFGR
jgi:hypothetical protein